MRHEDGDPGAHREHDRAIWPHSSYTPRRCDRQHDFQPRQGKGNGMSNLTHVELTWLKKRIGEGVTYDQLARELITTKFGDTEQRFNRNAQLANPSAGIRLQRR